MRVFSENDDFRSRLERKNRTKVDVGRLGFDCVGLLENKFKVCEEYGTCVFFLKPINTLRECRLGCLKVQVGVLEDLDNLCVLEVVEHSECFGNHNPGRLCQGNAFVDMLRKQIVERLCI